MNRPTAGVVVAVVVAVAVGASVANSDDPPPTPPEEVAVDSVDTLRGWATSGQVCLPALADIVAEVAPGASSTSRVPQGAAPDGLVGSCAWLDAGEPLFRVVVTDGNRPMSYEHEWDPVADRRFGDTHLWLEAGSAHVDRIGEQADALLGAIEDGAAAYVNGGDVDVPDNPDADVSVAALASLQFDPAKLAAPAGEITVQLAAPDRMAHQFVVELDGQPDPVAVGLDDGGVGVGTVELEAGTYTFYCGVPGHREAGMQGTLTVS